MGTEHRWKALEDENRQAACQHAFCDEGDKNIFVVRCISDKQAGRVFAAKAGDRIWHCQKQDGKLKLPFKST